MMQRLALVPKVITQRHAFVVIFMMLHHALVPKVFMLCHVFVVILEAMRPALAMATLPKTVLVCCTGPAPACEPQAW